MVYSAVRERRRAEPTPSSGPKRLVATRAVVSLDDRRYVLEGPRATIGRSKDAECVLRDPNVSRRHAELRRSADRRLDDRRPRLDQRDQGQRPARLLDPAQPRRPGHPRHHDLPLRHRAVSAATSVDYDPISVALKFGFLAVLYLFLLWIARSALKDLRRTVSPAPDATGFHQAPGLRRSPRGADAWLIAERGGGLEPGERFDLIGGLSIGRSGEADVRIDDRYASGVHARIFTRDGRTYVEDMNSTNGTLLNDATLKGRRS